MSEYNFTSITNDPNGIATAALQSLNPKHLIWIQFGQPIRVLKTSPAIAHIFQSFASECVRLLGTKVEGLAITYAGHSAEPFPSDYRFPLFISWLGESKGPSIPQLQDVLERICIRLRSYQSGAVFKSLDFRLARTAESIRNVIEVHDPREIQRHGIVLTPWHLHSLHGLCIHEAAHAAIARHYGHSAHWRVSPVAAIEAEQWIQWDGATYIDSDTVSRSQSIRIGLAGVVAEFLWENPGQDAYNIDDFIGTGAMELSLSDEAQSMDYSIRDMKDTIKLVRKHMPSILRDANRYMRAYEDVEIWEVAA